MLKIDSMEEKQRITPYPLRMEHELRQQVEEAAKTSGRSTNAEIVARLQSSFQKDASERHAMLVANRVPELMSRFGVEAIRGQLSMLARDISRLDREVAILESRRVRAIEAGAHADGKAYETEMAEIRVLANEGRERVKELQEQLDRLLHGMLIDQD